MKDSACESCVSHAHACLLFVDVDNEPAPSTGSHDYYPHTDSHTDARCVIISLHYSSYATPGISRMTFLQVPSLALRPSFFLHRAQRELCSFQHQNSQIKARTTPEGQPVWSPLARFSISDILLFSQGAGALGAQQQLLKRPRDLLQLATSLHPAQSQGW